MKQALSIRMGSSAIQITTRTSFKARDLLLFRITPESIPNTASRKTFNNDTNNKIETNYPSKLKTRQDKSLIKEIFTT